MLSQRRNVHEVAVYHLTVGSLMDNSNNQQATRVMVLFPVEALAAFQPVAARFQEDCPVERLLVPVVARFRVGCRVEFRDHR